MYSNSKPELSIDQRDREQFDTVQSKDGLPRDRALSVTASLKQAKSSDFFKRTRVDSCSYVVLKNGVAQAIPYRPKPKLTEHVPLFNQSENQWAFKVSPHMHVGMKNKPLLPYNPYSYRNRLPVLDATKPPKNASSIELGDRTMAARKHFVTTSRNIYGNFGKTDPITNTGILAERTKWHHFLQNK